MGKIPEIIMGLPVRVSPDLSTYDHGVILGSYRHTVDVVLTPETRPDGRVVFKATLEPEES